MTFNCTVYYDYMHAHMSTCHGICHIDNTPGGVSHTNQNTCRNREIITSMTMSLKLHYLVAVLSTLFGIASCQLQGGFCLVYPYVHTNRCCRMQVCCNDTYCFSQKATLQRRSGPRSTSNIWQRLQDCMVLLNLQWLLYPFGMRLHPVRSTLATSISQERANISFITSSSASRGSSGCQVHHFEKQLPSFIAGVWLLTKQSSDMCLCAATINIADLCSWFCSLPGGPGDSIADLEIVPFPYSNRFADPANPSLIPENLTFSQNPHTWAKVSPNSIQAPCSAFFLCTPQIVTATHANTQLDARR